MSKLVLAKEITAPAEIKRLRHELRNVAAPELGTEDRIDDFVLAVHEAVINVFRHAYPADEPGPCRLVVERASDKVIATIEDDGGHFNPEDCTIEHPEGESGRGLKIIRTLVDEFDCWRTPTGGAHVELRLALN